jgi:hypothetical protein
VLVMIDRLVVRFEKAGALLLFLAGAGMVALAVIVKDRQAVATTSAVLGAALMAIAVLLPRLEGPVKFGAQGFEAQLIAAVREQAEAHGLSVAETQHVIEVARTDTDAWSAWLEELLSRAVREGSGAAAGSSERTREPLLRLAQRYVEREAQRTR